MADPKKRRTVFDPIDEPNTEEGSQGPGTLVDNDLPGGRSAPSLSPELAAEKAKQEQEVTDEYAEEWRSLLESREEA